LLWIFKKNNDKKKEHEEDIKLRNKKKNDDKQNSEEEFDAEEIKDDETQIPKKITGPLRKKLVDISYNPINKEFLEEAKKIIKQVNKNKKSI